MKKSLNYRSLQETLENNVNKYYSCLSNSYFAVFYDLNLKNFFNQSMNALNWMETEFEINIANGPMLWDGFGSQFRKSFGFGSVSFRHLSKILKLLSQFIF
jgi:hypothetical protein